MKAHIFLILFLYKAIAHEMMQYSPNVGTVLFSSADLSKSCWSKAEISLLRVRRSFQNLLPSPYFIDTSSFGFVEKLLSYFSDAYTSIKREAPDPVADNIMTTALSDAIGGYLKTYVIPVTKYAFYGGSVSQDNAVRMFNFFNEIKRYLETDGFGWRDADENIIKSIRISVAPPRLLNLVRRMTEPCSDLAFYEKTPNGLTVPIPHVNWNGEASTMFVPLKNNSLIPLNYPDTSKSLLRFYDTAKHCLHSTSLKDEHEFDKRFQNWLTSDVVPHLNDHHIYFPFQSVLTLINDTKVFCHKVISKLDDDIVRSKIPIHLTSKKMLILAVVLFVEVAWCIPALMFIICSRKKKKDKSSNVYLFIDKFGDKLKKYSGGESELNDINLKCSFGSKNSSYRCSTDEVSNSTEIQRSEDKGCNIRSPGILSSYSLICKKQNKLPREIKHRRSKSDKISATEIIENKSAVLQTDPSNTSKCSHGTTIPSLMNTYTKDCSTDKFDIVNELHEINGKPSRSKSVSQTESKKSNITTTMIGCPDCTPTENSTESIKTIHDLTRSLTNVQDKLSKTNIVTFISSTNNQKLIEHQLPIHLEERRPIVRKHRAEKAIKRKRSTDDKIYENSDQEDIMERKRIVDKIITEVESETLVETPPNETAEECHPECPCYSCFNREPDNITTKESERLVINPSPSCKTEIIYKNKDINSQKSTRFCLPEEQEKKETNIGLRMDTKKHYVEIKLNKPNAEISVGIGRKVSKKVSKIPKRTNKLTNVQCKSIQEQKLSPATVKGSLIPQPLRRPRESLDDTAIKSNASTHVDRLNVTL